MFRFPFNTSFVCSQGAQGRPIPLGDCCQVMSLVNSLCMIFGKVTSCGLHNYSATPHLCVCVQVCEYVGVCASVCAWCVVVYMRALWTCAGVYAYVFACVDVRFCVHVCGCVGIMCVCMWVYMCALMHVVHVHVHACLCGCG